MILWHIEMELILRRENKSMRTSTGRRAPADVPEGNRLFLLMPAVTDGLVWRIAPIWRVILALLSDAVLTSRGTGPWHMVPLS
jgi:hypothetical protein